jgi:seryl-tRNA synthetase
MGLDILLFREEKGGNPNLVRESQRRRFKDIGKVDEIIAIDKQWSELRHQLDAARARKNAFSKDFGKRKKAGEDVTALGSESQKLNDDIARLEAEISTVEAERARLVNVIGNIVHESVPVSATEDDNRVERTWGTAKTPEVCREHDQLLTMIDGVDMARGAKVAGHRGYFLKGVGVQLNQAVMMYATNTLAKKGFTVMQTPLFMRRDLMALTAQLDDFDEMLYKVVEKESVDDDSTKYLIATSEQPLSALHAGEWLQPPSKRAAAATAASGEEEAAAAPAAEEPTLPLRYAGVSQCFRMEAGSAGRDVRGIFRVHQFEKVEQFCLVEPEVSWEEHERMLANAEEFMQSLGLPYQVVNIASGALNNAAAKKYDVECWFPFQQQFRELVSCSNCTDYQSRALEVRCGTKKQGDREKRYVHMLNSTLAANTRVLCCILENYQTPTGIVVPEVLRQYMNGVDFLPFIRPDPRIAEEKDKKKK